MTKGTTDEFIPESSEMDLTQKDQNIAILNEENTDARKKSEGNEGQDIG